MAATVAGRTDDVSPDGQLMRGHCTIAESLNWLNDGV